MGDYFSGEFYNSEDSIIKKNLSPVSCWKNLSNQKHSLISHILRNIRFGKSNLELRGAVSYLVKFKASIWNQITGLILLFIIAGHGHTI